MTQAAVPMRLSTLNSSTGMAMKPATIEMNVRTNGSARPTGTAQAPRPAKKRSARSTSPWVTSRYLPNRSTRGRPPARPTP